MEQSTETGIGPVLKTGHWVNSLVCEFESRLLRIKKTISRVFTKKCVNDKMN